MSYSIPLSTTATKTKLRTPKNVSPFSGMCSVCVEGCPGNCEVGRSAVRGEEVLYPQPIDQMQVASEKDYPVDFSHFNINGSAFGAYGIEADSDKAIFPEVNLHCEIGQGPDKIKLRAPIVFPALAKLNWADYYTGAALSGVIAVIGENVCAKDPEAEIRKGRIYKSPQLAERLRAFNDYYSGFGVIFLQANVDDDRKGLLEYAVSELGLEAVELKLGQGAKGIQGLGTIPTLGKALKEQEEGNIVYPNPSDPEVQETFKNGVGPEFLRVARLPMWDEAELAKRIEELRTLGAKYVGLKMGPFRPFDLARVVKLASDMKISLLTVDGAGGGTGMSPWKMMNEWGLPTVYLESMLHQILSKLSEKRAFIPDVAIAGGFALEDHIFKGLALGAPYIHLIGLGRAPMAAAMVGKTVGKRISEGRAPKEFNEFGESIEEVFTGIRKLKEFYGDETYNISPGAIGVYNYMNRVMTGLRQLLALNRKFSVEYIDRNDIYALTREAAEVSGITHAMEVDKEEMMRILG